MVVDGGGVSVFAAEGWWAKILGEWSEGTATQARPSSRCSKAMSVGRVKRLVFFDCFVDVGDGRL